MLMRWVMTQNQEWATKFLGNVREDVRRDAIWKMRTDAWRERISGTRAQIC